MWGKHWGFIFFGGTVMKTGRRNLLMGMGSLGVGLVVGGVCSAGGAHREDSGAEESADKDGEAMEVGAVEDLMREHGILRRALFVYSETAVKLRKDAGSVPAGALHKTAELFRAFGEDYHERKLEEAYVFPAVKKAGGQAAAYVDILIAQHERGRQITDFIFSRTGGARMAAGDTERLTAAMEGVVRMYRPHAAREDTVVFPAWKKTLTAEQLAEMSEKFEDIEHELFGDDGFDNVVRQIAAIEEELAMADLAQFTAPAIRT